MESPLDPAVAETVSDLEREGFPPWHSLSVAAARRLEDEVFSEPGGPAVRVVRDVAIEGPGGDLPVRIYRHGTGDLPVLVFYHGGGWTLGTLDSADGICRRLARRLGSLVLSVDYRLAPEHPFPAPLRDAWAAFEWATEHADAVGGDADRVAVGGTSAGGNLAAGVALLSRAPPVGSGSPPDGRPVPVGQLLCYPILDPACDSDSYAAHADSSLLSRADMRWFWDQYLRDDVDAANPHAAPARAPDLAGLPPAVVATAGHDVLRDEAVAYAGRLADAGVDVDHLHEPALPHGYLSFAAGSDVADDAFDDVAAAARRFV